MLTIDVSANTNQWRHWHPAEKVVPALALLPVNLVMPPWPTAALTVVATTAAATFGAGLAPTRWLRTLAWPAGFILSGALGIALIGGDGPGPLPVTMSDESVWAAIATAARSMGGVSVVVLMGSTTPMVDLIALLRAARVPAVVTDLMSSMYRLIFDLLGLARRLRLAQASRLGHDGLGRSMRSTALIATAVLRRALARARMLQIGLDARAYDGELRVISATAPLVVARLATGLAIVAAIVLVASTSMWWP